MAAVRGIGVAVITDYEIWPNNPEKVFGLTAEFVEANEFLMHAEFIAEQIAKRVEEEMTFPGEIKVTVLRETRAEATAR